MLDLEGEGQSLTKSQLVKIHEAKTAALLSCSLKLGGMAANATPLRLEALEKFGYYLGLAFQVVDDVLDQRCHLAAFPGNSLVAMTPSSESLPSVEFATEVPVSACGILHLTLILF